MTSICLARKYLKAKSLVIEHGYYEELDYYSSVNFNKLTEKEFIMELAWVILSSGIREKVVCSKFAQISEAFCQWSIVDVCSNPDQCYKMAISVFNNPRKIKAILVAIKEIDRIGIASLKKNIISEGINYLKSFPFIGDITVYHIAKNIGLNVCKPDRHLTRLAQNIGFDDAQKMCSEISHIVGDEERLVDTVLWRYATIDTNYLSFFKDNEFSF